MDFMQSALKYANRSKLINWFIFQRSILCGQAKSHVVKRLYCTQCGYTPSQVPPKHLLNVCLGYPQE